MPLYTNVLYWASRLFHRLSSTTYSVIALAVCLLIFFRNRTYDDQMKLLLWFDLTCLVFWLDEAVNELKFLELCHIGTMIVDFLSLFMRAMHLVMLGSQVHLSLNLARFLLLLKSWLAMLVVLESRFLQMQLLTLRPTVDQD